MKKFDNKWGQGLWKTLKQPAPSIQYSENHHHPWFSVFPESKNFILCTTWVGSESIDDKFMNGRKHFSQISFPPMRALEFITGHMVHNLAYT